MVQLPSGEIVTAYKPNGSSVASAIQIRSPFTGEIIKTLMGHTAPLLAFAYLSSDGILASAGDDKKISLWNITTGTQIKSWVPYTYALDKVTHLVALPNGDLMSLGENSYEPNIKVWDPENNFELKSVISVTSQASRAMVLLNNGYFASGSNYGFVYILNPYDELGLRSVVKIIPRAHSAIVHTIVALPNGDFATSGNDKFVKIWNGEDYSLKKVVTSEIECFELIALPFDHLACGSERNIFVWNLSNGQLVQTLVGHETPVFGLALLTNGELASSSQEAIKLWRICINFFLRTTIFLFLKIEILN